MSVVLQVSTSISFWTHNFFTGFDMIAENINRGPLICKEFTGVRNDCGLRDDLLLVNRLLVTVSRLTGLSQGDINAKQ